MELRRLGAADDAVRRFVRQLWLPYHRDLEAIVDDHALAEGDLVAEEVPFRRERLATDGHRTWLAVDDAGADGPETGGAENDVLAGFVATDVDECPSVFDRPDRLIVGDIYVREPYRGTGLADDLLERAAERARAVGCGELALEVDVDNERAIAFYEKRGFETDRRRMSVAVEDA